MNGQPQALVSQRVHLALALLTGLLYFLAFPGVDCWPLAFVAFVPWMVGLVGRSPGEAAFGGWLIGMVVHFTGFYWLVGMLETFSGFPLPLCVLFMAILSAYQGSCFAVLGWLVAKVRSKGWPFAVAFVLAFAAAETAFPYLFPFRFGTSVHEATALVQVAELGGATLVGLVLLAPNYLLALLVGAWLKARREGTPRGPGALLGEVGAR
ncbi:MAG TPA: apolipoprotein N-acyltransferase, partial [Polyangiaceae bacterium]|nr:apolipoprotein N-acyltransferase [Polyangiaceae bacterium]